MLAMDEAQFQRVVGFARDNYGINLAKKRALVRSRLALDIERRGFPSFEAYLDRAFSAGEGPERQRLIDRLSTNHTFFFREPGCFAHMTDVALPKLLRRGAKRVEIWCAASSTGQECYSLAMLLEEALGGRGVPYSILGSDISLRALEVARAGLYPEAERANIPERFRGRFLRPAGEGRFAVAPEIMSKVAFRQINLKPPLRAFPARAFPLIFCRNVMIYLDAPVKEALTDEMHRVLDDGGCVYVGSTETLDMRRTRFRYIQPSVFEKREPEE